MANNKFVQDLYLYFQSDGFTYTELKRIGWDEFALTYSPNYDDAIEMACSCFSALAPSMDLIGRRAEDMAKPVIRFLQYHAIGTVRASDYQSLKSMLAAEPEYPDSDVEMLIKSLFTARDAES